MLFLVADENDVNSSLFLPVHDALCFDAKNAANTDPKTRHGCAGNMDIENGHRNANAGT